MSSVVEGGREVDHEVLESLVCRGIFDPGNPLLVQIVAEAPRDITLFVRRIGAVNLIAFRPHGKSDSIEAGLDEALKDAVDLLVVRGRDPRVGAVV